jgi:hypothetical protein
MYLLVGLLCAAVISSCAPPPSPAVRAFGDNQFWIILEDMVYVIGKTHERIVVPKGFVTDFASIPQALWSIGLSRQGQYSRAAVVHDYLYWSQSCTRAQSDRLLVIAMKESNVKSFDEVVVYQGVSLGGEVAWDRNRVEREASLPRIIPAEYLHPDDSNMLWTAYRRKLVGLGVKDPPFEQNPPYCKYGDSTQVPHVPSLVGPKLRPQPLQRGPILAPGNACTPRSRSTAGVESWWERPPLMRSPATPPNYAGCEPPQPHQINGLQGFLVTRFSFHLTSI